MTYTYRAEPVYKKSIVESQNYWKDDKCVVVETGWRGGHFVFESDYPLEMTEDDLKENVEFCVTDYFINDMETWDSCWCFITAGSGATPEDAEEFEELWNEGSWEVEEAGWTLEDSDFYITGAMTLVDETPDGTVHDIDTIHLDTDIIETSSNAWPFPTGGST